MGCGYHTMSVFALSLVKSIQPPLETLFEKQMHYTTQHHHRPHYQSCIFPSTKTTYTLPQHRHNISSLKMASTCKPEDQRKPRFLCLHGFRTSAKIMKTQIQKWPDSVLDQLDLVFLDAPLPAQGKSGVEGLFDPPYFEWLQFDERNLEYRNFDESLAFIEDYMLKGGPFDGLMGFSQGGILSGVMPGLQAKGLALTKVPKIKYLIIIAGGIILSPKIADIAYASKIDLPSLHFIGERDFLKPRGTKLLESFVEPCVIHHPKGHTVPILDEKNVEVMNSFIKKMQKTLFSDTKVIISEKSSSI